MHRQVRDLPHFDAQPGQPTEYAEIRDGLIAQAERGPVFFKDMAFYVMPRIVRDTEFLERLTHIFLIRNPVAALLSYHKLDPGVTLEEVGIEAQWNLYDALTTVGLDPVVIEAEAVQRDTRGVMSALWDRIGLPYTDRAFEWQDETPADWEQVGGWHGTVCASSGIKAMNAQQAKGDLMRKSAELDARAIEAPQLSHILAHHRVYYERLRDKALSV